MTTPDERHGLVEAQGPGAVPLDQPLAALPLRAGSEAANLARAASAGQPVLPGFVVPDGAPGDPAALWPAWQELSEGGARPADAVLVVRTLDPAFAPLPGLTSLVGRTGRMAAAYLVERGEQSPVAAVRRNLAVGPPSIEQIYYGLSLGRDRLRQPPFPVVAVSRLVDAPRRMRSWL
ncbi:hypothetical protein ABT404_44995 [Streptomyces hyaluromycini]|uniref:Uncharacterized protein n=1 Tax=Streptomyces hyaluromycini TaxID=1377993 RepID=A0ABV1XBX8_9ACTN